jgi:hypothetical protein
MISFIYTAENCRSVPEKAKLLTYEKVEWAVAEWITEVLVFSEAAIFCFYTAGRELLRAQVLCNASVAEK